MYTTIGRVANRGDTTMIDEMAPGIETLYLDDNDYIARSSGNRGSNANRAWVWLQGMARRRVINLFASAVPTPL